MSHEQSAAFHFPTTGMTAARDAVLLAVDDYALPFRRNVCTYLAKPSVRREPVLTPSRDNPNAPDYVSSDFYGTVILDGGTYRMWYGTMGLGPAPNGFVQGPLCYAESDDGIHWTKPDLGQVEYKGSRHNNALDVGEMEMEGVNVIKDGDDPDPQRRYKLVFNNRWRGHWSIRTATSPDGIHWTPGKPVPIDNFLEQSGFYRYDGLYIVNAQTLSPYVRSEGGHPAGRAGHVWVSPDFETWVQESAESFALPEPRDPAQRGGRKPYPQVHLGTAAMPYGNVLVGLYCIWYQQASFWDISGDLGLVVSHDGIHFREPVKGHVYLSAQDSPAASVPGRAYPSALCQANGFVNVGDETRIYHGRWRNAPFGPDATNPIEDDASEIALATLPRDRWGALGLFPDAAEGSIWSAPIVLPPGGATVTLNADGVAGIRIEVSDDRFHLLPGYVGEATGSGIQCPVRWRQANSAALGGQRVRLRFTLARGEAAPDPCLYAVYLK